MPPAEFACPKCKTAFSVEPGTVDAEADCPGCASELRAHFFPAFFRPAEAGATAAALIDQSEASCFYHPQKQAIRVCDGCGRLICALCSIDLGQDHLCPNCISSGRKKGKLTTLENNRTRYDNIALTLAMLSIFMSFFSFILAPAAIYTAIRHWKTPSSIMGSGHVRMAFAVIISVGSLLLWGVLFGAIIFGAANAGHHHRP